ncbi:MAG TPA: DUF1614 domain-containing protein [Usitatibacter sp.]|nr:DUF1614 domain-containing protein [Usitatibacter sp.]
MSGFRWLSMVVFVVLLVVLPFAFAELLLGGLAKLQLSPGAASALMFGMIAGGLVNIPVKRVARDEEAPVHPLAIFGLSGRWPRLARMRRESVIAVNVGGCIVPAGLALYELRNIAALGPQALVSTAIACGVSIFVCYRLARPLPGIGIGLPGLVPALTAAMMAVVLEPGHAAPVAYVAGVAGPLVGADLLHLRDIGRLGAGVASIGGAGTFDGIVLSGIVAAYLS